MAAGRRICGVCCRDKSGMSTAVVVGAMRNGCRAGSCAASSVWCMQNSCVPFDTIESDFLAVFGIDLRKFKGPAAIQNLPPLKGRSVGDHVPGKRLGSDEARIWHCAALRNRAQICYPIALF